MSSREGLTPPAPAELGLQAEVTAVALSLGPGMQGIDKRLLDGYLNDGGQLHAILLVFLFFSYASRLCLATFSAQQAVQQNCSTDREDMEWTS